MTTYTSRRLYDWFLFQPRQRSRYLQIGLLSIMCMPLASPALAEYKDQFLFFPAAAYIWRSERPAGDDRKREGKVQLDLFYTADINDIRVLAEIFGEASSDSELEIERLQMSWKLDADARLWLGRFHNPVGVWNTDFHHGAFLQAPIFRPGIEYFEDDGGVIPTHITGALVEGITTHSGSVWHYDLALGLGPEMNSGLKTLELYEPGEGSHDLAISARLSWQPGDSSDHIGLFAGRYDIPGAQLTPAHIRQELAGLFARLQLVTDTNVLAAMYFVSNELALSGVTACDSFRNGYLQVEQPLGAHLTAYGRAEGTSDATADTYLTLFGEFVRERQLVGLRYELAKNQAVKAEVGNIHQMNDAFRQLTVQWSAVYP